MTSTRRRQPDAGSRWCNQPATFSPHFFKFVDSVIVQKLKIPGKFARKYGENLANTIFLKVPKGAAIWRVESKKCENGEVWFERGWQDFVDFHSIKFGDFLVFRYEGNSLFCVLIFDKTATEIEYPFKNENHGEEINVDDDVSVEILDDFPSSQTRKEKRPLHSQSNCSNTSRMKMKGFKVPKMEESEDDDVSLEILDDFPSSQTRKKKRSKTTNDGSFCQQFSLHSQSYCSACRMKMKGKICVKCGKDPNKPKKPANPYFVFMEEFRKHFKEKHPDNKSVAAVAKAAGEKWKSLSNAEKARYIAKAEKMKVEYNKNTLSYVSRMAKGPNAVEEEEEEESDQSCSEDDEDDD